MVRGDKLGNSTSCGTVRAGEWYGGPRKKRFLLPFWEKRGFGAKTLPKIDLINLIEAFDTNILSI